MGDRTDRAMRESAAACAEDARKHRKRFFAATNEPPGRDPQERQNIETLIDGLNQRSNERERDWWNDRYESYGGDPADLNQSWDLR